MNLGKILSTGMSEEYLNLFNSKLIIPKALCIKVVPITRGKIIQTSQTILLTHMIGILNINLG